jgi:hypothetical protein
MMDRTRTEEQREALHQGVRMTGPRRLFAHTGIMVLVVTFLSVMNTGVTLADDQPIPSMTIGYQTGAITAIYEKTLEINGRAYGLMPEVIMLDEHEETLDPARLMVTAEVKFHVMKEQSNKIDKMIVTLPR